MFCQGGNGKERKIPWKYRDVPAGVAADTTTEHLLDLQWGQVRIDSSTVLKQSIIIGSEENRCDAEVDLKHTWKSCHTFQFNVELLAIAYQLLQLNITAKGKLRFVLGFQQAKYWSGPIWQYREEWWNSILTDNFG